MGRRIRRHRLRRWRRRAHRGILGARERRRKGDRLRKGIPVRRHDGACRRSRSSGGHQLAERQGHRRRYPRLAVPALEDRQRGARRRRSHPLHGRQRRRQRAVDGGQLQHHVRQRVRSLPRALSRRGPPERPHPLDRRRSGSDQDGRRDLDDERAESRNGKRRRNRNRHRSERDHHGRGCRSGRRRQKRQALQSEQGHRAGHGRHRAQRGSRQALQSAALLGFDHAKRDHRPHRHGRRHRNGHGRRRADDLPRLRRSTASHLVLHQQPEPRDSLHPREHARYALRPRRHNLRVPLPCAVQRGDAMGRRGGAQPTWSWMRR